MVITSKTNKTVAFVASLKNKKARREHSAYVVEGKKMVAEAFAAGKRVKLVMVAESVENEMSFPIEHITVSQRRGYAARRSGCFKYRKKDDNQGRRR